MVGSRRWVLLICATAALAAAGGIARVGWIERTVASDAVALAAEMTPAEAREAFDRFSVGYLDPTISADDWAKTYQAEHPAARARAKESKRFMLAARAFRKRIIEVYGEEGWKLFEARGAPFQINIGPDLAGLRSAIKKSPVIVEGPAGYVLHNTGSRRWTRVLKRADGALVDGDDALGAFPGGTAIAIMTKIMEERVKTIDGSVTVEGVAQSMAEMARNTR